MKDNLKVKDNVEITITKKSGEKISITGHNFLTNPGRLWLINRLSTTVTAPPIGYFAVGSGDGATVNSTTLVTEIGRVAVDSVAVGTDSDADKLVANITVASDECMGILSEFGLFTSSSGGTMVAYIDKNFVSSLPVTKELGDVMTIRWLLQPQ